MTKVNNSMKIEKIQPQVRTKSKWFKRGRKRLGLTTSNGPTHLSITKRHPSHSSIQPSITLHIQTTQKPQKHQHYHKGCGLTAPRTIQPIPLSTNSNSIKVTYPSTSLHPHFKLNSP